MTTKLTDAEIDGLTGNDLRDAVARAIGWTTADGGIPYWYAPGEHMQPFKAWLFPPIDVNNKGAALSLLLGLRCVAVNITGSDVSVITGLSTNEIVTIGPKEQAAAVMFKAFLKLENRKAE